MGKGLHNIELQVPETSSIPFWKVLTKFYQRKEKLKPFVGPYKSYRLLRFLTIFIFKVYNFSITVKLYKCVVPYNRHFCDIISLRVFSYAQEAPF